MDKVNPYNYQNNKVNEAIFKLDEMMEKLTIDHLIPYSNHKLGLMDLSSLGHIPTTMILEGFDLHLKDKPLIAERTNWSLDEIKPILHPLSDLTNDELHYLGCILSDHTYWSREARIEWSKKWLSDKGVKQCNLKWSKNAIEYLYSLHIDLDGLIEKELAIDINTLK